MGEIELGKIMIELERSFMPEKASGFAGIFQCHIVGAEQGDWVMVIKDQRIKIDPGSEISPRATLELSQDDLIGLLTNKLDPLHAYFSGKVQLHGDMPAVMKLLGMFHLDINRFK